MRCIRAAGLVLLAAIATVPAQSAWADSPVPATPPAQTLYAQARQVRPPWPAIPRAASRWR